MSCAMVLPLRHRFDADFAFSVVGKSDSVTTTITALFLVEKRSSIIKNICVDTRVYTSIYVERISSGGSHSPHHLFAILIGRGRPLRLRFAAANAPAALGGWMPDALFCICGCCIFVAAVATGLWLFRVSASTFSPASSAELAVSVSARYRLPFELPDERLCVGWNQDIVLKRMQDTR